ncbi:MAG: hypothetical protein KA715_10065 [Xanthomonadaceae bacterium]|nr:hypothetical protein [Xanthomonadaceae bacterium]
MKYVSLIFVALLFSVTGCVSSRMSNTGIDAAFRDHNYAKSTELLRKGLEAEGENGRDRLLYLLDLGVSLYTNGEYKEAITVFRQADKIAEIKDYTSLATEAATLLVSDNNKSYRAEDFENVLINVYLSMCYAALGEVEDAAVESRRANRKLQLMKTEGKRNYKQNAYARYLSGIFFEMIDEPDNAYIDYKEVLKLDPAFEMVRGDLVRLARKLQRYDDLDRYQKLKYPEPQIKKPAEIIVLYENGMGPIKIANPEFSSIPMFRPRANTITGAEVIIDGNPQGQTVLLDNIENTAITNLQEQYAGLVAKKIGGAVVKTVVADQIGKATKNETLGFLAYILFFLADTTDTRSWLLLPQNFQIARIPVDPGEHEVKLKFIGGGDSAPKKVKVSSHGKAFLGFRSY